MDSVGEGEGDGGMIWENGIEIYIKISKDTTKRQPELINEFSKVKEYRVSFWFTSLCMIGPSFIHLIRTDSNLFFLMAE